MFKLITYKGLKGLESIRKDWERIFSTQEIKHFYESYGWFYGYTKNLNTEDVVFFCIKDHEEIVAIIPLEFHVRTSFLVRKNCLQTPDNEHFVFNGVIFDGSRNKKEITKIFLKLLSASEYSKWHILKLSKLIASSSLLLDENYLPVRIIQIDGRKYHKKQISNTISDTDIVPKSLYKSIRKHRNRISRAGDFSFRINKVNEDSLTCFERFLSLEASGWKGEAGSKSAIKLSSNLLNFYLSLIINLPLTSNVYIFELVLNEEEIASTYMILDGETAYGYKIGYNEKYSKLAPGKLLYYYLLLHLKNELDIKELNFTSNANWQEEWGVTRNTINDYVVYNNNIISFILFLCSKAKIFLKKKIRAVITKKSRK